MSLFRNLILASIFITSYFIFLAWQNDTINNAEFNSINQNTVLSSTLIHSQINQYNIKSVHDDLIKINTNNYIIYFSKQNGNIVRLGLLQYPSTLSSNEPFFLLNDSKAQFYQYQSGFLLNNISDTGSYPVDFTCNLCSIKIKDKYKIDLIKPYKNFLIHKIYTISDTDYKVTEQITIVNSGNSPIIGSFYNQLVRGTQSDPSSQSGIRISSFLGAAWWTPEKSYNKIKITNILKNSNPIELEETGGWIGFVQHYFLSAIIPQAANKNFYSIRSESNHIYLSSVSVSHILNPNDSLTSTTILYFGPKITDNLKKIGSGLDLTVDYGWLWPIAEFLFVLLNAIHSVINNWGWSIIILTIFVKGVFWPLSASSYRAMAQMRKLSPEIEKIKVKYGNDRQQISKAMMEFYKNEKLNPLGGCLPMIIQMPVFIALYWTLMESIQLRHSAFIFWIHDLSDLDHFFILPILMGISMYVQQTFNPKPADPVQAKMMRFMPIIFTFFFLFFPSGLVLYWIISNVISIIQQVIIKKRFA